MDAYTWEWVNLFFRWFHVIAGIAWIGASFYFVWLDNNLRTPPQWKQDKGIGGDLWAIHGGGFYEVAKYKLGPESMPEHLHWFKWEAYTTWLSGMALLWIVYYVGADRYLIDPERLALSSGEATLLGLGFILAGFVVYEALLRTPLKNRGLAFGIVLYAFLVLMTWIACSVFSPRGAYIHVGAVIGTIMAGNVFLGIIPSQKALVAAVSRGEAPDPSWGLFAKLRSTHNNYLTLPLIFIMISNHYPMTYSHEYNWLILAAIGLITAVARHFFNLRHRGQNKPMLLVVAAALTVLLAVAMRPQPVTHSEKSNPLTSAQAMQILQTRCNSCHAAQPTQAGFTAPPAGVMLETLAQVRPLRAKLIEVTQNGYMPLGNMTQMTEQERAQLISWLATL